MLRRYFDYIFVHIRKKVRLRPKLSPKFFFNFRPEPDQKSPNPTRKARTRPEKPAPTYNSGPPIEIASPSSRFERWMVRQKRPTVILYVILAKNHFNSRRRPFFGVRRVASGGQRGHCPPDFYFCPTDLFLPPLYFFLEVCILLTVKIVVILTRVSNRTWTRTVNPTEPFHFGEPVPNLNQQNFTSVNLNQTWTLKIVLKWTQTEPEPLTKVRIYFSISGCHWRWYTHNKSSGDHQQDQQFLFFFLGETSNDS